jgi:hypothetical protein
LAKLLAIRLASSTVSTPAGAGIGVKVGQRLPLGIHDFKAAAGVGWSTAVESDVESSTFVGLDQSSGGCLNFPITMLVDQRVYFLTDPREAAVAKVAKGVFSHTAG